MVTGFDYFSLKEIPLAFGQSIIEPHLTAVVDTTIAVMSQITDKMQ